jgi:hypothetical protein
MNNNYILIDYQATDYQRKRIKEHNYWEIGPFITRTQ